MLRSIAPEKKWSGSKWCRWAAVTYQGHKLLRDFFKVYASKETRANILSFAEAEVEFCGSLISDRDIEFL